MAILRTLLKLIPDSIYIKFVYYHHNKRFPNLRTPELFTEKIQWLKLHDRKPEYTIMVDKYLAKEYVSKKIGNQYIIPTLQMWENTNDIDFDILPDAFVLKCNNDSGGIVICKDKDTLDKAAALEKLSCRLDNNGYWYGREWPYKDVKPCIIAEPYMEDNMTHDLRDYKFFCFNGKPRYCQVIANRSTAETVDFFDMDWIHQNFTGVAKPFKPYAQNINKPYNFEKMKEVCNILAVDTKFLRVDFYEVNGKLYFGELTFYPASGFGSFSPNEWDAELGALLKL